MLIQDREVASLEFKLTYYPGWCWVGKLFPPFLSCHVQHRNANTHTYSYTCTYTNAHIYVHSHQKIIDHRVRERLFRKQHAFSMGIKKLQYTHRSSESAYDNISLYLRSGVVIVIPCALWNSIIYWLIDLVVSVFANGLGNLGSIPGLVIPKILKWYLISPCLTLSNIKYVSRVEWSNPGKEIAPPTPWCSCYWKGSLLVALDYGHQLYFLFIILHWF